MKDLGLHFTTEMVRAIMDGRKTQDRRPMTERNPFGATGDTLWVRETWRVSSEGVHTPDGETGTMDLWVDYRAGHKAGFGQKRTKFAYPEHKDLARKAWGRNKSFSWRPSIHMPRWASRIDLIVKAVRTQRLGDMTEEEARAEGVGSLADFRALWASIYSKRGLGWEAGRVVRVCEFEVKR